MTIRVLAPSSWFERPRTLCSWTDLDYDVVLTLAVRVRLLGIEQAGDIWWSDTEGTRDASKHLRQLASAGLLQRFVINAHPRLKPAAPLARWNPHQPAPDSHELSDAARSRWNEPAVSVEVFTASKQAANLFGSDLHGLPKLEHRDHDLLLTDVYAVYRRTRAQEAQNWVGEGFLPKAGYRIKDPDAFLIDASGQTTLIVESAGHYSPQQIRSFHKHCAGRNISYELW